MLQYMRNKITGEKHFSQFVMCVNNMIDIT